MAKKKKTSPGTLGVNRKARHNYSVVESFECGIELKGTEVKSMKAAHFTFTDTYGKVDTEKDEVWLAGLHVNTYEFGNRFNHDPDRPKKLLLHKEEIIKLRKKVMEKGLTLVPLKFYLKQGLVKVELGVCKGKKLHDKRADLKSRDLKREADRELKKY